MDKKVYSIGTLNYSLKGVIAVSLWLLWGGLIYHVSCSILVPTLIPLLLDRFGASSELIAVVIGSIPAGMNMVMNPVISTASDRTRTRWGRRIPFLAAAAPVIALMLLVLGWAPQIVEAAMRHIPLLQERFSTAAAIIGLIIGASVVFQFFNLFIGTVFFYLYPDVIPREFIGRFVSVLMVILGGSSAAFNFFFLQYAREYAHWIYTGFAAAFLLSFAGICLFVKEGEYPPAEAVAPGDKALLRRAAALIRMYVKDCLGHRFFVLLFIGIALTQVSTLCRNIFNLLFAIKELGLTEAQYGYIMGVSALISVGFVLATGYVLDRVSPLLIFMGSGVLVIFLNFFGYFMVHDYTAFFVIGILMAAVYAIQNVSTGVCLIQLFPAEKYGQFCSANASLNCIFMMFASYFGGVAIDRFGYRFIFVWDLLFTILATGVLLRVYRLWRKLGGTTGNYVPPVS